MEFKRNNWSLIKKLFLYSFLVLLSFYFLPTNAQKVRPLKKGSTEKPSTCFVQSEQVLSEKLYTELLSFYNYTDSISKTNPTSNTKIIFIEIDTTGNECHLIIGNQNVYNSQLIEGTVLFKEKLISFYSIIDTCNQKLIDTTRIKNNHIPSIYPDEKSLESIQSFFDPWGRKYKIHNEGDLDLIYQGSF